MALPPEGSPWLLALLGSKFFSPCPDHPGAKKNEANIFCLQCHVSLCQHCLGETHDKHKLLQIRRYVYHDVVRLQDISRLVDCAGVQAYTINSARVVFLKDRPQPRPSKCHNSCRTCQRSLQEDFQYCSLGCKIQASAQAKAPMHATRSRSRGGTSRRAHQRTVEGGSTAGAAGTATDALSELVTAAQSFTEVHPRCKAEPSTSSDNSYSAVKGTANGMAAASSDVSSGGSETCPEMDEDVDAANEMQSPPPLNRAHLVPRKRHRSTRGSIPPDNTMGGMEPTPSITDEAFVKAFSGHSHSSSSSGPLSVTVPGALKGPPLVCLQDSPTSATTLSQSEDISNSQPLVLGGCMRSLFQDYEGAGVLCSPPAKRRKSQPHRSPAF